MKRVMKDEVFGVINIKDDLVRMERNRPKGMVTGGFADRFQGKFVLNVESIKVERDMKTMFVLGINMEVIKMLNEMRREHMRNKEFNKWNLIMKGPKR